MSVVLNIQDNSQWTRRTTHPVWDFSLAMRARTTAQGLKCDLRVEIDHRKLNPSSYIDRIALRHAGRWCGREGKIRVPIRRAITSTGLKFTTFGIWATHRDVKEVRIPLLAPPPQQLPTPQAPLPPQQQAVAQQHPQQQQARQAPQAHQQQKGKAAPRQNAPQPQHKGKAADTQSDKDLLAYANVICYNCGEPGVCFICKMITHQVENCPVHTILLDLLVVLLLALVSNNLSSLM